MAGYTSLQLCVFSACPVPVAVAVTVTVTLFSSFPFGANFPIWKAFTGPPELGKTELPGPLALDQAGR